MTDGERERNIAWAREVLVDHLVEIGDAMPGFPTRTVIVRDPAYADRYIVVSNEQDEVTDALLEVIKSRAPAAATAEAPVPAASAGE